MKIFVTGNRGFIGNALYNALVNDKKITEINGFDLKEGKNILDIEKLEEILSEKKYDAIIHLAAKTSVNESHSIPEEYWKTNAEGTRNIVEMANKKGVKKIVYAATAASLLPGSSPYGDSKAKGEEYLNKFNGDYVVLRLFNVVGRRSNPNYCGVIDLFRKGIEDGKITIYGDGEQTRDFIHIGDVCDAFIKASFAKSSGTYQIGTGKQISINKLAKMMIGNKKIEINYAPARKEVRNSVADVSSAKKQLSFEAKRDISEFFI